MKLSNLWKMFRSESPDLSIWRAGDSFPAEDPLPETNWAGREEHPGTKILIATLSAGFAKEMEADANAYRRHYGSVEARLFRDSRTLEDAIQGIDLLHLFAVIDPNGNLITESGQPLTPKAFLGACLTGVVKVVIVASPNDAEAYRFPTIKSMPFHLVLTLSRRGGIFPAWLDRMAKRMAAGDTLPEAWVAESPQVEGPWQDSAPGCICQIGCCHARLLN